MISTHTPAATCCPTRSVWRCSSPWSCLTTQTGQWRPHRIAPAQMFLRMIMSESTPKTPLLPTYPDTQQGTVWPECSWRSSWWPWPGPLLLRGQHLQVTSHPQSSISSPLLGCVGADLGWAPDCGPPADFLPPRPGTGLVLGGPRPGTTLVCTQRHLSSASVFVTHHIS